MWLDQTKTYAECFHAICDSDIVKKGNPDLIKIVQVSNSVSSIKNQGADCILPKAEFDDKQFKTQGLGRFFTKVSSTEQDLQPRVEESKVAPLRVSPIVSKGKSMKEAHKQIQADKREARQGSQVSNSLSKSKV